MDRLSKQLLDKHIETLETQSKHQMHRIESLEAIVEQLHTAVEALERRVTYKHWEGGPL